MRNLPASKVLTNNVPAKTLVKESPSNTLVQSLLLPANQRNNTCADSALSNYFEQLTDTQEASDPQNLEAAIDPVVDEKREQAARLLRKANDIAMLLDDAIEPTAHINSLDLTASAITIDKASEVPANKASAELGLAFDTEQNLLLNSKENTFCAETLYIDQTRDHSISLRDALPERFQVLLCKVAGLTIAVPLVELGGIHELSKISKLAGKPDWFKGILIKGDMKYQCIDAARWIMPEKFSPERVKNIEYKFAIQLGKTPFILCCESVSSTIELNKSDIKWRTDDKKRPWLAGLLKEKMCALIDGARMVQVVLAQV